MKQLNLDFCAIVIACHGNDYLPAIRGVCSPKAGISMWDKYLNLRGCVKGSRMGGRLIRTPPSEPVGGSWGRWTAPLDADPKFLLSLLDTCSVPVPSAAGRNEAGNNEGVIAYLQVSTRNHQAFPRLRSAFPYRSPACHPSAPGAGQCRHPWRGSAQGQTGWACQVGCSRTSATCSCKGAKEG